MNSQSLADGAVGEAMEPLESTPLMKEVYPSQSRESWDLVVGLLYSTCCFLSLLPVWE